MDDIRWKDALLKLLINGHELEFLLSSVLALTAGVLIGRDREAKGKPAGVSTHCFVVCGAMLFCFVSTLADPNSPARIAAQVVTGVGFLGAGVIMKGENGKISNLTTAADLWFSAAIGTVTGFRLYGIAVMALLLALAIFKGAPFFTLKGRQKGPCSGGDQESCQSCQCKKTGMVGANTGGQCCGPLDDGSSK